VCVKTPLTARRGKRMTQWSEKDRTAIIDLMARALPAYETPPRRLPIRLVRRVISFNMMFSLLCVSIGLVVAFWVFPARPAPFLVTVPIFPLFGATAMARWLGGAMAGWCSASLSLIAIAYFWLPSVSSGSIAWLFGIGLVFACVATSAAGSSPHPNSSSGGSNVYRKVSAAR
jgi:hypothetical protein